MPRQVVPAERVHIPGRATGRADLPHPALGQDITLAHATPSAVPEHFAKFDRLPNLRVLTASCVGPELRPLSSTGVTRLPRYYRPLRHPRAPDPSLTGDRLLSAEHTLGFPVLRALSLCTCCRHIPRRVSWDHRFCSCSPSTCQPSPIPLSGRPAHRPFRGLLSVYSRCGLHTRAITNFVTAIRGLQTFRHLHACPGCFRLERVAGRGLHPLEKRRLVTAHVVSGPSRERVALGGDGGCRRP